jgi:hypothetical protein
MAAEIVVPNGMSKPIRPDGWSSILAIHRVMGIVKDGGTVYIYDSPLGYMSSTNSNLGEVIMPVKLQFIVKPRKDGNNSN